MRKMKSVIALASTLAVMACQTAVASSAVMRQSPVPSIASTAAAPGQNSAVSAVRSESVSPTVAAERTSHRKTWIIVGVVAAIVAVALIVAGSSSGSGGVY